LQKIVILTIVYGNSLWESIDVFVNFILNQMPFLAIHSDPIKFSFWLVLIYISIHLLAGIAVGIFAVRIQGWLELEGKKEKTIYLPKESGSNIIIQSKRKKRSWVRKPSIYAVILFAGTLVILSYLYPEVSETQGMKALIMIVRSTCILVLWYTLIGPYLLKIAQKYLGSKKNKYAEEVQKTINILVPMRNIVYQSWAESRRFTGFKRFKKFILMSLITILLTEFSADEDN
jgi:hypothetical protein